MDAITKSIPGCLAEWNTIDHWARDGIRHHIENNMENEGAITSTTILNLLDRLDALDPPPMKPEDDPRFHFVRVTNDLSDLQGKMAEVMDRLKRLDKSARRTRQAFNDAQEDP